MHSAMGSQFDEGHWECGCALVKSSVPAKESAQKVSCVLGCPRCTFDGTLPP